MTTVASQVSSSCAPSEYPSSEYKKIRVIGSGTTAHVWEATHPFHGTVAVKQFEQRFKFHAPTELGLLSRVQGHPNFPKLFDFWEDHKGSYIAMELMKGDLLSEIENQMTIEEVLKASLDILQALKHLHSIGLVHFDLKPENICIGHDGVFKIVDMGSAHTKEDMNESFQTNINSGKLYLTTVNYRPPEAFVEVEGCKRVHDEKTDIWSFGCIFYEMLSDGQLFEQCSDSSTCEENEQEIDEGLLMMESMKELYHSPIPKMLLENSLVKRSDSRLSASDLILRFLSLSTELPTESPTELPTD